MESNKFFYYCPSEDLKKFFNRLFTQTEGNFLLYYITSNNQYYVETYQPLEIDSNLPTLLSFTPSKSISENSKLVPRYLISIQFNLDPDLVYCHNADVSYWFYNTNDELDSLSCFKWWMKLHSEKLNHTLLSDLQSSLSCRILLNCDSKELKQYHNLQFIQIDLIGSDFQNFNNSFQKTVIIIVCIEKSANGKSINSSLDNLLSKIDKKRKTGLKKICCFFLKELPSEKEFPDIAFHLQELDIPWYMISPTSQIPSFINPLIKNTFDLELYDFAETVLPGTHLFQENLNDVAQSYFKGNKMTFLQYWDLLASGMIIERTNVPIVESYLSPILMGNRPGTFVVEIQKLFPASGATSFLFSLAYKMRDKCICLIIKNSTTDQLFIQKLNDYSPNYSLF